eukprot:CAMPEP_0167753042 /NCGR_PEP_ID=MMETSP0110_2-20121227/7488_1 /TAXON_ID=629695 /ORGANISM="Gymnochlora sp., Strain CCMP2014" /LENGTH=317 /DNA_ID=CAMNT_0007638753 /DNA_START=79 /DNA_END=1032 /DNA_ORIENTATION=-
MQRSRHQRISFSLRANGDSFHHHNKSTLVLIRHGESTWNRLEDERFTGWYDAPLSEQGILEAKEAGKLLKEKGLFRGVHVAFTSKLNRSCDTLNLMLSGERPNFPVIKSWRLNERHYGALQGYNKDAVAGILYPKEEVRAWRRSWDTPPPRMEDTHPHYDVIRSQYTDKEIQEMGGDIPRGESLEQTAKRLIPFWEGNILPYVLQGKTILIVAHANSLRSLIGSIFEVPKEDIEKLRIPTGTPLVYNLDRVTAKPFAVPPECGMLEGELLWPLDECPVLFDDFETKAELTRASSREASRIQNESSAGNQVEAPAKEK